MVAPTTPTQRKREIRADGLIPIECPVCHALFFYAAPESHFRVEIRCQRRTCGRIETIYFNMPTEVTG